MFQKIKMLLCSKKLFLNTTELSDELWILDFAFLMYIITTFIKGMNIKLQGKRKSLPDTDINRFK